MAKRLSEIDREKIIKFFNFGKTIEELSNEFNCSRLTITRNLKKIIGEKKYKEIIFKTKASIKEDQKKREDNLAKQKRSQNKKNTNLLSSQEILDENYHGEYNDKSQFIEIAPLNYQIDSDPQIDLASVHISAVQFPKIVYMIVDKKVELETKFLKDYPKWQFLSEDELKRKTIEIYLDIKIAKGFCGKEQKVIKVPNTNVFKIVAPILLSRGISRIVSSDTLIAL